MPENLRFQSEDEIKEQETLEHLKEEGGIYFRQETNPENGETTNFVNILGIEVETYASEEDIESIKKEMILSPVDQDLLRTIAQCYKLRQPLLFEGDPGAGKTFLMEKLTKLVHGKDAPVLELVGTPRTSELEILGHWAPKGLKEKESQEYKEILKDVMGKGELAEFQKHLNEELEKLNADFSDGKIKQEEFLVIKLNVDLNTHQAILRITDGNKRVLYTQNYEYTDAKTGELTLFYTNGVLMYAGEY